jgi:hypothetical protein
MAVPRPVAGGSLTGGTGRSRDSRAAPSMVIAAFVRAKLFGIKILTLDARIALAPADAGSDVTTVAAWARAVAPPADRFTPRLGERADLALAVRLLEEGSKSLDEVRAMRSLNVVSPE